MRPAGKPLEEYEKRIGYRFRDKRLLETALTHSSFANENKCKSYERLEFLGDSVLGFVTAEYLFENFPQLPEGQLTAAIYLDSGSLEEAKRFILRFIAPAAKAQSVKPFKDYKTTLQEIIQQNPEERLEYVVTGESGPDHDKHFTVEVHLNSNVIGKGGGRSKKEAEQQAAREALELMGY